MHTVEEALEALAAAVPPGPRGTETVPLAEALGRVLAADVTMDHDVPPFRRATMDGFAARREDLAVDARLAVEGVVHAGDWPQHPLTAGRACRVMTGAPVPEGTDAVVPFEWCMEDEDGITLTRVPDEHTPFVVERGAHLQEGAVVLRAGTRLDPGALGVLATAGAARVEVAPRVRVGILGTGSELVGPDAAPGPGAIRNSNSFALTGQILRAGHAPVDLGVALDDRATLEAAIAAALPQVDVLLLSGGVSKGDLDLVPEALEAQGVQRLFHRWSVQPGGPLWCGQGHDTIVFGLPGNPAAVFVGFEILVVPVLRALAGVPLRPRALWRARLEGAWGRPGARRRFRPVRLTTDPAGALVAEALPWKGSGDPFTWAHVHALAVMPEETPPSADGGVDVIPLIGDVRDG